MGGSSCSVCYTQTIETQYRKGDNEMTLADPYRFLINNGNITRKKTGKRSQEVEAMLKF